MKKNTSAFLFFPKKQLSSLIFAAIIRDTQGLNLQEIDRYNFFPATPFCSITWVLKGELFRINDKMGFTKEALPNIFVSGPRPGPLISWSSGDLCAITISFFPDAWHKLTNTSPVNITNKYLKIGTIENKNLSKIFEQFSDYDDYNTLFEMLQNQLIPLWKEQRQKENKSLNQIKDWASNIFTKTALSQSGKSVRQIQRHLKNLTGHSKREIENFIRLEEVFAKYINPTNEGNLANLSIDTGFSDQSHMGRMIKKMIGNSPAAINELIMHDERYWFYRLLAQNF